MCGVVVDLSVYALRLIIKRSVFCSWLLYDMTSIKIPYFITCIIPSCIEIRVNSESTFTYRFHMSRGEGNFFHQLTTCIFEI